MANLQIIKAIAKEQKVTIRELAKSIGITEAGLQKLIRENSTKVDTLELISKRLNVPISVFFDESPKEKLSPKELMEFGNESFAGILTRLFEAKTIAPYSLIEEKDKEIEKLNREIGRLEERLSKRK